MSASSKKKLRKENAAELLTEKQRKEQAEAKKLRNISIAFVCIMLVVALAAAAILIVRGVNNSGVIDRNTVAAVTGDHELNSVQMNYYFTDYVRSMYQQWKSAYGDSTATYVKMLFGLDLNQPLNKQEYEKGVTWADHFLKEAYDKAKSDYALYDKAMAEGFKLSKEDQSALDSSKQTLEIYAMYYGYKNPSKYLQANYGFGSDLESYMEYSRVVAIASGYYNQYKDALTYDDAAIREHEKDKYNNYTSYSYATYYVGRTDYLVGGTKDDKGNTVYSDAEKEAAIKEAERVANELAQNKTLEELDKAITALPVNKDKKDPAVTAKNTKVLYTGITDCLQSWLSDANRAENDIAVIADEVTTKDADGKETKTLNGYYVVVFQDKNENLRPLANVRHLLVQFEGGTTGSDGNKVYSDAEKAKAKEEAEKYLEMWKNGAATEESFIELVKKHSDDGSAAEGGLFEDIHEGSAYVDTFKNWSIDPDRKAGDTAVIISEYGYHVMYYVGDGEMTYRDYMISEELRADDVKEWYDALCEAASITTLETKRLNTDLIMGYLG